MQGQCHLLGVNNLLTRPAAWLCNVAASSCWDPGQVSLSTLWLNALLFCPSGPESCNADRLFSNAISSSPGSNATASSSLVLVAGTGLFSRRMLPSATSNSSTLVGSANTSLRSSRPDSLTWRARLSSSATGGSVRWSTVRPFCNRFRVFLLYMRAFEESCWSVCCSRPSSLPPKLPVDVLPEYLVSLLPSPLVSAPIFEQCLSRASLTSSSSSSAPNSAQQRRS